MLHVIFASCQVLKLQYQVRVVEYICDLPIKTKSVCQMEAQNLVYANIYIYTANHAEANMQG